MHLPRGPASNLLRIVWLIVGIVLVFAFLEILWVYLQFSIYQYVYSLKAGLSWFSIVFYHNYTFVAAALFSFLLINPKVGHSDFWRLMGVIFRAGIGRVQMCSGTGSEVKEAR